MNNYMLKERIKYYIYFLLAPLLCTLGCTEDTDMLEARSYDASLLGQGVSFNASLADPFVTRTTYRHDGSFNEEDIMTIYRQYSYNAGVSFDATTEAYRVYWLKTNMPQVPPLPWRPTGCQSPAN